MKVSGESWLLGGMILLIVVLSSMVIGLHSRAVVAEGNLTSCIRALEATRGGR